MAKTIKDLRQEKGYRSAREFADALGIATSSMSRYDKDPETIPLKHAWAMADLLDCSIDEVVGRERVTAGASELQDLYDGLLPETRSLMDDFVEFVRMKDEALRSQRKADEDRRYEDLCRYYERMFSRSLYEGTEFGKMPGFASYDEERSAFEEYLTDQAARKGEDGMRLHLEGLEEELRGGYIDADGTEKHWTDDEIQSMLADERAQMDEEYGKKDKEVIDRIMEAYDRLFGTPTPNLGPRISVEYHTIRMPR